MVLPGPIIITVVLTALMVPAVPGIRWRLPAPMPAADPDRALAVLDDHLATLSG
jgi:hypothetical protein